MSPSDNFKRENESSLQRWISILSLAIPSILCSIMRKSQDTINLIYIGKLSNTAMLAGVSLGGMTVSFLGQHFILGLNNCITTFVSQAAGNNNLKLCGVYLNRGRFIVTVLFIPICIVLTRVENILLVLRQDPIVANYAQQYIHYFLPGIYLYSLDDLQRKFLNSLGKNSVPLLSQSISVPLHIFWSYIFIIKYDLGIKGTGLSGTLTNFTTLLINCLYSAFFLPDIEQAVFLPDKTCFDLEGIKEYLSIGIPSAIMFMLDAGAFQIMVMTTGFLGVVQQGTNAVMMNIVVMIYMLASGLQQASTTLIGQKIGKGDVQMARKYYRSFWVLTVFVIFLMVIIQIQYRESIVGIYTDNQEIEELAQSIMWLVAFHSFPDICKGMLQGVIAALGQQGVAIWVNFVSQWMISLFFQWYFAFHLERGLIGVWYGKMAAECSVLTGYLIVIDKSDWNMISSESQERQKKDGKSI